MLNDKSVMAVIRAARPLFGNNYDKVAFVAYASFLAADCILTATGPPAFSDNALTSSYIEEVGIEHWNELVEDYAFVYVKSEKVGKKVLVKCLAMNDKLLVDALAEGASGPVHLKIDVKDYVADNGSTYYSEQLKNLDKLVQRLDEEILSKLDDSSSSSANSKTSLSSNLPRGVQPPVNPIGGSDPAAGMYPPRSGFSNDGSMFLGWHFADVYYVQPGHDAHFWFGAHGTGSGFPGGQPGVPSGARFSNYILAGFPGFELLRFASNQQRPGRGRGCIHPNLQQFGGGPDFM